MNSEHFRSFLTCKIRLFFVATIQFLDGDVEWLNIHIYFVVETSIL
jgi:hypothetical protein